MYSKSALHFCCHSYSDPIERKICYKRMFINDLEYKLGMNRSRITKAFENGNQEEAHYLTKKSETYKKKIEILKKEINELKKK